LAAGSLGFNGVVKYYTEVGPQVSALYANDEFNQSLWIVGTRLFSGMAPLLKSGVSAPPLIDLPQWAAPVSTIVVLAALIAALAFARRTSDPGIGLGLLICLSVSFNPVSWIHGWLLFAVPLTYGLVLLEAHGFPELETWLWVLSICVFYFGKVPKDQILGSLGNPSEVSFAIGMVAWLPSILLLVLTAALLVCLDRRQSSS
jgi:hypothetical protein